MGGNIIGEAAEDLFGIAVELSNDGTVVAISARSNDANGLNNSGHVRVLKNEGGGAWNQLGTDVDGPFADGGYTSGSLSLSNDGLIFMVGIPGASTNNLNKNGQARVYVFDGNNWNQLGQSINGETRNHYSARSVSISGDAMFCAVSSIEYNGRTGYVRVFKFTGSSWSQVGNDMIGGAVDERFGASMSLSETGGIIAVGAPGNNGPSGNVRVFYFNGFSWIQMGNTVNGGQANARFGYSVALSRDGQIFAAGSHNYDGPGTDSGQIRVFQLDGNNWMQVGSDINGESGGDKFGRVISLSDDGCVVASGSHANHGINGVGSGNARVFSFDGTGWNQLGNDLDGKFAGDMHGIAVSLSGNGKVLAVGAARNDGNGLDSGAVTVYEFVSAS